MSYILDALRRAQSERERGSVPGLHSQSLGSGMPASEPAPSRAWLVWLGVVLLAAALLWQGLSDDASPEATKSANSSAPRTSPSQPASTSVVNTLPAASPSGPESAATGIPTAAPAQPAEVTKLQTPANAAPLSAAPAKRPAAAGNAAAPAPASAAPQIPPAPTATTAAQPAASAQAASAQAASTIRPPEPTLAQGLPSGLRGQLPELKITGAVYAQDRAQRMLLVNNQLMREGDKVRPDLTLERIELKGAVFNYQGTRFRLNY